ncbi:MAG: hypothetical protein ACI8QC_002254 [Planctomycetota bacterium]|jgi:hypothetical protein
MNTSPQGSPAPFQARATYIEHPGLMKSRVHPKYKARYRITNWREYEQGLVRRGDVTI